MKLSDLIKKKLDLFLIIDSDDDMVIGNYKIKKDLPLPILQNDLSFILKNEGLNIKTLLHNIIIIIGLNSSNFKYKLEYFKILDNLFKDVFNFCMSTSEKYLKDKEYIYSIAAAKTALYFYEYKQNKEKKNLFKSYTIKEYFLAKIFLSKIFFVFYDNVEDSELKDELNNLNIELLNNIANEIDELSKLGKDELDKINKIIEKENQNKKLKIEENINEENYTEKILDLNLVHNKGREITNIYKLIDDINSKILAEFSFIYFRMKNYSTAYSYATKSLKLANDKDLKEYLLKNIQYMEDMKLLEEGINAYNDSLYYDCINSLEVLQEDFKNQSYEANYYLASAKRKVGQINSGYENLKIAKELNDFDVNIYVEIASYAIIFNDYNLAKNAIIEGLKIDSNSYYLTEVMVQYYKNLNKIDDMNACLKKLEEIRNKTEE